MEELLVHGAEEEVIQLLTEHQLLSSLTIKTDNGPSNLLLQGSPLAISQATSLFLNQNIPTFPVTSSSPPPLLPALVIITFLFGIGGILVISGKWGWELEWEEVEKWAGRGVWYLFVGWIFLVVFAFGKLFSYSLPWIKKGRGLEDEKLD
jgi:hypothetical protein